MRQHSVTFRALVSGAAVLFLVLLASLPSRLTAQGAVTLEPVTSTAQTGDPGDTVTYTFRLINNTCGQNRAFDVTVSGATFSADFDTPITVAQGAANAVEFDVTFTIPSTAQPGTSDDATVIVTSRAETNQPTCSTRRTVVTTVTTGGATVTPTRTPTRTPTPTRTGTPVGTPRAVCQDTFEVDDTPDAARELRPDQQQTHTICPGMDNDWLFFGGLAGKVFTIDVPAMTDGLDLSLSLYDAQGNLLAFNDDFPRDPQATDVKPRIQSWRAPANGTYYVRVRDAAGGGGQNLSYNVILITESYGPTPTLVAELCTDLYEPDGVPEQARLIVVREVQPNHRICPSGDSDWIRFFGKAGSRFVLRTDSRARPGVDTVMILTDRDASTILDFNDDSGGTLDSRIEFTPSVDGFYFAQVKNAGDIGNQFIAYDFYFEPLGVSGPTGPTTGPGVPTTTPGFPTTSPFGTPTPTVGFGTLTPTVIGTPVTTTPTGSPTATSEVYPLSAERIGAPKGQPAFVNGNATQFIDPAFAQVWSRTDQPVAGKKADRTWMWGPAGLVGRAELYREANGGVRQVQYFDKARMEITDWQRDRSNPWFVTNGLLVREMIEGRMQTGDNEFLPRAATQIGIAGDADDRSGPTYASFAKLLGRVENQVGQTAAMALRRDGSTAPAAPRTEARLAYYVPETGHNIPQVFWDFLRARGPIGDGTREETLVDWVFAMGYPISEPYWTRVKVGGTERDVLVQAFQRRVLTFTPTNPSGWQVEMGNVGRHYYLWRYGKQP